MRICLKSRITLTNYRKRFEFQAFSGILPAHLFYGKGKFVSAEALLRLFDPNFGFISPELLVTAAEKSGAIHQNRGVMFWKRCAGLYCKR